MEEVLVERERVPKMVEELKHLYSGEKSIRGRVLLSEAFKILENYSQMPDQMDIPIQRWEQARKMEMPPQGKVAFTRNIVIKQRLIREPGGGCIWCGSRRLKALAEFPGEGFTEYECKDCKNKFFR